MNSFRDQNRAGGVEKGPIAREESSEKSREIAEDWGIDTHNRGEALQEVGKSGLTVHVGQCAKKKKEHGRERGGGGISWGVVGMGKNLC